MINKKVGDELKIIVDRIRDDAENKAKKIDVPNKSESEMNLIKQHFGMMEGLTSHASDSAYKLLSREKASD